MSIYIILVKDYIESESESEKGKDGNIKKCKSSENVSLLSTDEICKTVVCTITTRAHARVPTFCGAQNKKKKKAIHIFHYIYFCMKICYC